MTDVGLIVGQTGVLVRDDVVAAAERLVRRAAAAGAKVTESVRARVEGRNRTGRFMAFF